MRQRLLPVGRPGARAAGCLAGGSPTGHCAGFPRLPAGAAVNDRLRGTGPITGLHPAESVQVVPAPWPSGAPVSLLAELEARSWPSCSLRNETGHPRPRAADCQRGGLVLRARLRSLPSSMATAPGSSRAAWAAGSRRSSVVTCSPAPASRSTAQQHGHGARVAEGGVGGGALGQRGDLLLRARLPQPVQQAGHVERVVEGDVGGGPARGADVSAEVARRAAQVENSVVVAPGGGVLVELRGVTVQAAIVGGITQRGLVAGEGVACRRGPEAPPGDSVPCGGVGRADRGNPRAGTAARPGCRPGRRRAARRCPASRAGGA